MSTLKVIEIGGKQIVVEVDPTPASKAALGEPLAPEGAELTGIAEKARDAAAIIEDTIAGVASAVLKALEQIAPNECSVELGLTFKGEHNPIPVLVKVAGEASIKVTAKWVKPK